MTVTNYGTGGSVLDAQLGSTAGADSNDPTFLAYDGTPYLYLPGVAGNTLTTTAPATTHDYLATRTDGTTATGAASAGAFTFSTAGSWVSIALRDSSDVVLTTVDLTATTSGAQVSWTGSGAETWTLSRSTSGRKAVAVVAPCWLLGTDDYMEVVDNDLLDFGPNEAFTVLAIVRDFGFGSNSIAVAKKTALDLSDNGYALFTGTTGLSRFGVTSGGGGGNGGLGGSAATAGALTLLAGVRDSTSTITTYRDTTSVSSTATAGSLANGQPLRIGTLSTSVSDAHLELVAVAVFRRALTAAEIAALSDWINLRMT